MDQKNCEWCASDPVFKSFWVGSILRNQNGSIWQTEILDAEYS